MLSASISWHASIRLPILVLFLRANDEMSKEVAGYLQQFPEEMIFDTRKLDLLDSVGQGKKCYDIRDFLTSYIMTGNTCMLSQ